MIVLPINHRNVGVGPSQPFGGKQPAKSGANDYNLRFSVQGIVLIYPSNWLSVITRVHSRSFRMFN